MHPEFSDENFCDSQWRSLLYIEKKNSQGRGKAKLSVPRQSPGPSSPFSGLVPATAEASSPL